MPECVIIPPKYAIDSMMYSGYKDAAHAVSELIDNSIQAGENLGYPINVQVICVERQTDDGGRCGQSITHIGVYDNASGMSKDTLQQALQFGGTTRRYATEGMGKFGMGLPNASISQANNVEVYSWQNGKCYYTYLDVEEIKTGSYVNIPEPVIKEIPKEWKARIEYNADTKIGKSGTLVVWSNLERLRWKRHSAFFKHTEFLMGRIYRHFINKEKSSIRLASYIDGDKKASEERLVRPNDPLYLMSATSSPEEFSDKAAFVEWGSPYTMKIKDENGKEWSVIIRSSVATKETRKAAHHSKHKLSNHAQQNMGISLVRAGREIELNRSFINQSDPTERWWGVEVEFQPGLDKVFGITNNKQSAINFKRLTKDDIATEENVSLSQVMDLLEQENNPLKGIVELTIELDRIIKGLRGQVEKTAVSQRYAIGDSAGESPTPLEKAADDVADQRFTEGKIGESDTKEGKQTEEEKQKEIEKELVDKGLAPEEKERTIIEWLKKDKFIFDYTDSLPYLSDIVSFSTPAGKIKVSVNTKHPAWQNIISEIQGRLDDEILEKVKDSIMLLFAALARAEDETSDEKKKETIQEYRSEWGRIARDMIRRYNGE